MKPLIIARPFLFLKATNGKVERDFVSALQKLGYSPVVLCSDRDPLVEIEEFNPVLTHENTTLYYILSALGRIGFGDLVYQPDQVWLSWGKGAEKKGLELLRTQDIDYIHSISMTFANHTVGLNLKKKTGKPWIAQFYEPWSDNPFKNYKTPFGRRCFDNMERDIAENADVIIHNNQAIADVWIERYGSEIAKKIVVLPLMADFKPKNENPVKKTDKVVINHIGNLYGNRTAKDFVNAVKKLFACYPEDRDKVEINFIGGVNGDDKTWVKQSGLSDVILFRGSMSEQECVPYYEEADLYLTIDLKGDTSLFFPSKIIKYFYYGKPIMSLTSKCSVLDREMIQSKNFSFEYEDYNGMVTFLHQFINNAEYASGIDLDYWKKFTSENVITRYNEIVKML